MMTHETTRCRRIEGLAAAGSSRPAAALSACTASAGLLPPRPIRRWWAFGHRLLVACFAGSLVATPLLLSTACGSGESNDGGVACESGGRPERVGGTWILTGEGKRRGCGDDTWNREFELGPATFEVVMDDPNQYDASVPRDAGSWDAGVSDAGTDAEATDGPFDGGPFDAGPWDGGEPADGGVTDGLQPGDGSSPDAPDDASPKDARAEDAFPPVYEPATLRLRSPIAGFDFRGEVRGECVTFETAEVIAEVGTVTYEFRGVYDSFSRRIEGTFTSEGPGRCSANGTFTAEIQ